jgi:hypothetical protein
MVASVPRRIKRQGDKGIDAEEEKQKKEDNRQKKEMAGTGLLSNPAQARGGE